MYWLDNVRRTVTRLVFMLLVLPWFMIIFRVAWCGDERGACDGASYVTVRRRGGAGACGCQQPYVRARARHGKQQRQEASPSR